MRDEKQLELHFPDDDVLQATAHDEALDNSFLSAFWEMGREVLDPMLCRYAAACQGLD